MRRTVFGPADETRAGADPSDPAETGPGDNGTDGAGTNGAASDSGSDPTESQGPRHTRSARRTKASGPQTSPLLFLLCVLAFALLAIFYLVSATQGKGTAIGIVLVPLFCGALAPWLMRLDRAQPAFRLLPIAILGLLLRCLAAFFRLENAADAIYYHEWGVKLAPSFRSLQFAVDTEREIPGTGTVRYISGLVSVFTGSSMFAEFLVFTIVAFIGCVFLYMAFVIALPNGDHRRYALLVFLWPTMIYWPSSIGKEALVMLGVGVASYGAARLFRRRRGGIAPLILGLWFTLMVRPHIALVLVIAFGVAFIFTRRAGSSASVTAAKLVAVVVLVLGGGFIVGKTADFLEVESLGSEGIEQALDQTAYQTSQGGSEFNPIEANNPAALPGAIVTVLLRPFPNEAHTPEALGTSLEGFLLVLLAIASLPRIRQLPRALQNDSYVGYSLSAILLFCFLFSYVANFGILARQRAQVLPFVFVLLAFVVKPRKDRRRKQSRGRNREPTIPMSSSRSLSRTA